MSLFKKFAGRFNILNEAIRLIPVVSRNTGPSTYYKLFRMAQGMKDGNVYTGPRKVEIYPTLNCNARCLACWRYSPLNKGDLPPKDSYLPKDIFLKAVDGLAELGTEEIAFSGGGEPFLHPDIFEIIERIKKRGLSCSVYTNLIPLKGSDVKRLVELGVDHLTCSIWAGDAQTYVKTHPGFSEKTFEKVKRTLMEIKNIKERLGVAKPEISINNVIFNRNYRTIGKMIDFGFEVGANKMRFTPADVVTGGTESLALSEEQKKELAEIMAEYNLDSSVVKMMKRGDSEMLFVDLPQFTGRVEYEGDVSYDHDVIENIACTIGWSFLIIYPNGDVIPCCVGNGYPMGNLLTNSIKEIWQSTRYRRFRQNARDMDKRDPYFKNIDCLRRCDNLVEITYYNKTLKDPMASFLITFFSTFSKILGKLPERSLDLIFSIKMPPLKDIGGYSLPLDIGKRDSYIPFDELKRMGVFLDETGGDRARRLRENYSKRLRTKERD